jgi:hypothetical protein
MRTNSTVRVISLDASGFIDQLAFPGFRSWMIWGISASLTMLLILLPQVGQTTRIVVPSEL